MAGLNARVLELTDRIAEAEACLNEAAGYAGGGIDEGDTESLRRAADRLDLLESCLYAAPEIADLRTEAFDLTGELNAAADDLEEEDGGEGIES